MRDGDVVGAGQRRGLGGGGGEEGGVVVGEEEWEALGVRGVTECGG